MPYSELLHKINLTRLQGEIMSQFVGPDILAWLEQIDEITWHERGEVLLEARNRVVALKLPFFLGEEEEVVVKNFRPQGLARIRTALAGSKAKRAFYGALALKQRGVNTPEPVAYLEPKNKWKQSAEYYVAFRVRGKEEVRTLFRQLPPPALLGLLRDLAGFLRHLHDCQLLHRDLSDGNILAGQKAAGSWDFWLLDTNRVRQKKKIGHFTRLKNLVRLGVPDDFQKYFLEAYLQTGRLPALDWLWYRWQKLIYTYWVRAKKFLRLRALARRLKLQ